MSRVFTIILGGSFIALYLIAWGTLRSSEVVLEIKNHLDKRIFVREKVGENYDIGLFDSYLLKKGKGKGTYTVELPVQGELGSGIVQAKGKVIGEELTLNSIHLFIDERCFVYRIRKDLETECKDKRLQRWTRGRRVLSIF